MNDLQQNQRHLDRHGNLGSIDVYDTNSDIYLGRLVNIHAEGLMIMGEAPLQADHVYQLDLLLPRAIEGDTRIQVGVDCLWVRPPEEGDDADPLYWSGCHIIDLSDKAREQIETLIA